MKIPIEIIHDFNNKMDEVRYKLIPDEKRKIRDHPTSTLKMKDEMIDVLTELSNRMEDVRRVFNHYAKTGEVKIPD